MQTRRTLPFDRFTSQTKDVLRAIHFIRINFRLWCGWISAARIVHTVGRVSIVALFQRDIKVQPWRTLVIRILGSSDANNVKFTPSRGIGQKGDTIWRAAHWTSVAFFYIAPSCAGIEEIARRARLLVSHTFIARDIQCTVCRMRQEGLARGSGTRVRVQLRRGTVNQRHQDHQSY